jgi:hypothetical protein
MVPFGVLHRVLRLQFAHRRLSNGCRVQVAVLDEPVVGDDRHTRLVRRRHDRGARFAVVRRHHQDLDALRQQVLGLAVLQRIVVVGRLHQHLRPELLARGHEQVAVTLPAFLAQRVQGKADGSAA